MAYTSGGVIQAQDYNWLTWGGNTTGTYTSTPSNLAYVWGVGSGAYGYGQDVSLISALSVTPSTTTVTAAQWSGLVYTVNKALGHQGGTQLANGSNIGIAAGATITAFANVATAITTINTNYASFGAQGSTTTGTAHTAWNPTAAATSTLSAHVDTNVTFTSAQHARYFFNAGGQLNFVCSSTDNAGTSRSTALRDSINSIGGITAFRNLTNGGRTGTGGTYSGDTSIGYRDITTTPQTIATVTQAAPYSTNYANVAVFCNSTDTTNGAISASVVFRLWVYAAADDSFGGAINLSTSVRVDTVSPETTYLSSTAWGTPTITYDNA